MKDLTNLLLILAAYTLGYFHTGAIYWLQYLIGLCVVLYAWFAFNMVVKPVLLENPERKKMTDEEWNQWIEDCFFLQHHLNMGYNEIKALTVKERRVLIDKFIEEKGGDGA